MKLFYLVGYLLSPFALIAFHLHGFITSSIRVRVVVKNEDDEVLLVQSWLGTGKWGLPGGGIKRGEPPEKAAVRELWEETGIKAKEHDLRRIDTFRSAGRREIAYHLLASKESLSIPSRSKFEIKQAAWYPTGQLPTLQSMARRIVDRAVEL